MNDRRKEIAKESNLLKVLSCMIDMIDAIETNIQKCNIRPRYKLQSRIRKFLYIIQNIN